MLEQHYPTDQGIANTWTDWSLPRQRERCSPGFARSETITTWSWDSHETPSTLQYTVWPSASAGNMKVTPSLTTSQADGASLPSHRAEDSCETTHSRPPSIARLLKSSNHRDAGSRMVSRWSQSFSPLAKTWILPPPGRRPSAPRRHRLPFAQPQQVQLAVAAQAGQALEALVARGNGKSSQPLET